MNPPTFSKDWQTMPTFCNLESGPSDAVSFDVSSAAPRKCCGTRRCWRRSSACGTPSAPSLCRNRSWRRSSKSTSSGCAAALCNILSSHIFTVHFAVTYLLQYILHLPESLKSSVAFMSARTFPAIENRLRYGRERALYSLPALRVQSG